MSRLTGNDAKGLMEAYSAVYAPQELTEEQVWEEVENWVNSLLEEGYDLSEYTWEDMYEDYINEASDLDMGLGKSVLRGGNKDRETRATAQRQVQTALGQGRGIDVRGATSGAAQGRGFGAVSGGRQGIVVNKPLKPGETQQINVGGRTLFPAKSGNRTVYLPSKDAKPATPLFKSSNKPVPPVDKDKPVPPTRTPAAPAKVSPTPTKPALGPTGKPLVGGIERRTPTRAEMGAAKAYRTPAATTGTLGAATAVASKPAAFGSTSTAPEVKATNTAAAKTTPTPVTPKPNLQQTIRANRGLAPIRSSYEYDAYDLVLEYLLSQGHADTLEEAHYVMMEMDAETIGSIVEGVMPEPIDPIAHNKSQRLATQQGKIRALEGGATTPGEKGAAKSKLKGPQLPGV